MAHQAITTKYHGPTNCLGSRVSASTESGIRRMYNNDVNEFTIIEKAVDNG